MHKKKYQDFRNKILNLYDESVVVGDGPPFTSGSLHLGTIYNKCLKNMVISSLILQKKSVVFNLAFDNHGLSVEKYLSANPNINGTSLILDKQQEFIKNYNDIFLLYNDQKDPTYTDSKSYRKFVTKNFLKLLKKNKVKEETKIMQYCLDSGTIVSSTEQIKTLSMIKKYYVLFESTIKSEKQETIFVAVYTTTLWTIPGSRGIVFNSKLDYKIFRSSFSNKLYISLNPIHNEDSMIKFFNFTTNESYLNSFDNKELHFYEADFVQNSETGLVNIVPNYNMDDYEVGKKYNLQSNYLFNENNQYKYSHLIGCPEFCSDINIIDEYLISYINPEKVTFDRREVILVEKTKKRPIPIITKQLFVDLDKEGCLKSLKNINMQTGNTKLINDIQNRDYWCISRNRSFGLSIPWNYAKIDDKDYEKYLQHFLDSDCVADWSQTYFNLKSTIFDCWFETSMQNIYEKVTYDYVIEGLDQTRGWFQNSILMNHLLNKKYCKNIFMHSYVMQDKKNKMSKSDKSYIFNEYLNNGEKVDFLYAAYAIFPMDSTIIFSSDILHMSKKTSNRIKNLFVQPDISRSQNEQYIDEMCYKWMCFINAQMQKHVYVFEFTKLLQLLTRVSKEYLSVYQSRVTEETNLKMKKMFGKYIFVLQPELFWILVTGSNWSVEDIRSCFEYNPEVDSSFDYVKYKHARSKKVINEYSFLNDR